MRSGLISPDIQAVFFDAVGTLIEPRPSAVEVYHAAGRRHGLELSGATIAQRFREAFRIEEEEDAVVDLRVSEEREQRRWRRIVAAVFGAGAQTEELFNELWAHFAHPDAWGATDEVGDVLRELAGFGLTLGMASNFDHRLHAVAAGLWELEPLRHCIVSSEVGWRKPAPRFFEAVVRAAGCKPGQILFVGDRREVDYDGANAAGLRGVLLDPSPAALPGVQCIRRLSDLLA